MIKSAPAQASTTPSPIRQNRFNQSLGEEAKEWLRKTDEARTKATADAIGEGLKINPETAIVTNWGCKLFDPYGVCDSVPQELDYDEIEWFVCDPKGKMWVLAEHLPEETQVSLWPDRYKPTGR